MIDARARGLANLHTALTTLFVGLLFWAWAYLNLTVHVPYIHMNPKANLLPYFPVSYTHLFIAASEPIPRYCL